MLQRNELIATVSGAYGALHPLLPGILCLVMALFVLDLGMRPAVATPQRVRMKTRRRRLPRRRLAMIGLTLLVIAAPNQPLLPAAVGALCALAVVPMTTSSVAVALACLLPRRWSHALPGGRRARVDWTGLASCALALLLLGAYGFATAGRGVGFFGPAQSARATTTPPSSYHLGASALTAGWYHSVALSTDGTVYVWGENTSGALGTGDSLDHPTPVALASIQDVVAVSAGYEHTVALRRDGTVWAWGLNDEGQLGDGTTTDRDVPTLVPSLTGIVAVAAGGRHSLALKDDGTVVAWGNNLLGQLGDGTTTDSTSPVAVSGLSDVVALAAGALHSVALLGDASVAAWGSNTFGQLGDGSTTDSATPVAVDGLANIVAVASGGGARQTLALDSTGNVWAWGYNAGALLGTGNTGTSTLTIAEAVQGLDQAAVSVATNGDHSLAVMADGTARAWGANADGQLGDGTATDSASPVTVLGIDDAGAMAAGIEFSLALLQDGTVKSRGANWAGQLGESNTADVVRPYELTELADFVAVAAGGDFSAALKDDGTVWTWGHAHLGQLGDGTLDNDAHPEPRQVPDLDDVIAIAAGGYFTLALKDDGTVWAWGDNGLETLGVSNSTLTYRTLPDEVPNLSDIVAISAGLWHGVALKDDGTVWTWGYDGFGELGTRSGGGNAPAQVTSPTGIVAIAASGNGTLVLDTSGDVLAWGSNEYGQLGQGTTDTSAHPTASTVPNLSNITAVTTGGSYNLALNSDGEVFGWGFNDSGQLGDGTTTDSADPVMALNLDDVIQVAGGSIHTLAVQADGTAWSWGSDFFGLLGNGNNAAVAYPTTMTTIDEVEAVDAGFAHSLALRDGVVWGWGQNALGQTGNTSVLRVRNLVGIGLPPNYLQRHAGAPCSAIVPCDGETVNVIFGNFHDAQQDFAVPGPGLPLAMIRTYNSLTSERGDFGYGWTHPFDISLVVETSGAALVRTATGRLDRYTESGGLYTPPADVFDQLVQQLDGTWTLTTTAQTVYNFDTNGALTEVVDLFGNALTIVRTSTTVTITNPIGRGFTLTYGSGATAERIVALDEVGGVGRGVDYAYNAAGDLVTVTDVRGGTIAMTYDIRHRLTSVVDADGRPKVANAYDSQGRVIAQQEGGDPPTTLEYDPVNRKTIRRDMNGAEMAAYWWDGDYTVPTRADGGGGLTQIDYSVSKRPECVTNALGNKTAYTYDGNGNLTTIIDGQNTDASCALVGLAVSATITYNAANQPLTFTDGDSNTTTYAYDGSGFLTTVTNARNETTTYTYIVVNLTGGGTTTLVETVTDPLNHTTTYAYNGLGQVTGVTNALSQTTTLEYDGAGRLVEVTEPGGVVTCTEYDDANQRTATVANCVPGQPSTASQNVRTEYGYDGSGRQIWTKGPTGEIDRTFYGPRGLVERTVAGCYSSGDYSTTTCDPFDPDFPHLNRATEYGYDERGRRTTIADPLGVVTLTEYDEASRPYRTVRNYVDSGPVDATTNVETFVEYDDAGRVVATVDPLGRRTVSQYNGAGYVVNQIGNYDDGDPTTGDPDSDLIARTEYTLGWNPNKAIQNWVDWSWDAGYLDTDNTTLTEYDELNRPFRVIRHFVDGTTDPGEPDTDLISETVYDGAGNAIATIDPLGRVTVTEYDELNRVVAVTRNCTDGAGMPLTSGCDSGHGAGDDENLRSETTYTVRGQVDTRTDVLGRVTKYTYDPLGRVLTKVANYGGATAPADVTTSYTHDAAGRVLTTTDPLGKVWTTAYNGAGWQATATDPTSRATTFAYDGNGRQIGVEDPLGHQSRTIYDPLGRVVQGIANYDDGVVTGGDGNDRDLIAATEYDESGRRVASVAPDGRRTEYAYDGLDRLVGVTENAGGATAPADVVTTYGYDRRSLLTSIVDANSHTRARAYNAAGWQVGATDGLSRTTTTAYDRAGRTVSTTDPRPVTVTYAYDLADRVVSTSATGLTTIQRAYDVAGRRTSLVDGTGTTTYAYDVLDRVVSAAHSVIGTVAYGWDDGGRRTSTAASGGVISGAPTLTYLYDDAGRPTFVQRNGGLHAEATYDTAGRLATVARTNPGLVAGATTTYTYDDANRVTGLTTVQGATTLGDFGYTYARDGRVTGASEAVDGTTRTVGYTYDGLGRVTGSTVAFGLGGTTTYAYGYDDVGNRTSVSVNSVVVQARSYDAADQVVGWTYDDAGNLTDDGTQTYTWDPLGRLLGLTGGSVSPTYTYTGDGHLLSEVSGTTTIHYVLDTEGGLVERLGAVTTTTSATTSVWYSRGLVGELSREAGGSAAQTWYLADRLGSVRAEYGSSAASSLRADYDPFGQPEAGTGLGSPTDYGFAGEAQDSATGLVQLRARWYQPASGTLLGRDPWAGDASTPQTLNPYAYAHNDPVNLTDPTGNFAVALAALTMPGGITDPLAGPVVSGVAPVAGRQGQTLAPDIALPQNDAPLIVMDDDPERPGSGSGIQADGWGKILWEWGIDLRQTEAGQWLPWMLNIVFKAVQRMAAFLFNDYSGQVFRSGPLQDLEVNRFERCGDGFQCADEQGMSMPNFAWCANRVSPVDQPRECGPHADENIQRTAIHELGHYWDAMSNPRWGLSAVLYEMTGGRKTPRSNPLPGRANFCPNIRNPSPADECYVPGMEAGLPSTPKDEKEDWAEAVAFRAFWDQPTQRGLPGFENSWRWYFVECAAEARIRTSASAFLAAGCASGRYGTSQEGPGGR